MDHHGFFLQQFSTWFSLPLNDFLPPTCLQIPPIKMTSEQSFKITIPDDALALLKRKLDDTCLPDEVKAAEWAYGVPLADIKRLLSRWKDGYEWRTHERELNTLPMFTRPIAVDGFGELNLHYVHQRSTVKGAIPLHFVHGCTSSVMLSSESLFKVIAYMVRRARKFPRGDEDAAAPDCGFC